jgi:hypothetical protein
VSVLFCDLVGFTAASESADPEDVRARIRPYHTALRHELERCRGTVEKFIGVAVMAVFGAPLAHEDDPERAVRCFGAQARWLRLSLAGSRERGWVSIPGLPSTCLAGECALAPGRRLQRQTALRSTVARLGPSWLTAKLDPFELGFQGALSRERLVHRQGQEVDAGADQPDADHEPPAATGGPHVGTEGGAGYGARSRTRPGSPPDAPAAARAYRRRPGACHQRGMCGKLGRCGLHAAMSCGCRARLMF